MATCGLFEAEPKLLSGLTRFDRFEFFVPELLELFEVLETLDDPEEFELPELVELLELPELYDRLCLRVGCIISPAIWWLISPDDNPTHSFIVDLFSNTSV